MKEFEYFVMMAWCKPDDLPCAAVIGETKLLYFPYEDERKSFAQKHNADYITIEKRYSYEELPFEG